MDAPLTPKSSPPFAISFAFPGLDNVRCAFGTRLGGVGRDPFGQGNIAFTVGDDPAAVAANRRQLMDRLGVAAWKGLKQVHGTDMAFDPDPEDPAAEETQEGDGLATAAPGLALVIKTADCQPVLLAHRSGRFVAGLHVGWRGNRADFPGVAVRALCDRYSARPDELMAVRGPSLGPGSSEFVNFDLEWGDGFRDYFDPESRTVDLWRLTRDQLARAGLREDRVFSLDLDTYALPEFFSYRRDRPTGRQASLVWISRP